MSSIIFLLLANYFLLPEPFFVLRHILDIYQTRHINIVNSSNQQFGEFELHCTLNACLDPIIRPSSIDFDKVLLIERSIWYASSCVWSKAMHQSHACESLHLMHLKLSNKKSPSIIHETYWHLSRCRIPYYMKFWRHFY